MAVRELEKIGMSDIDRVVLYHKYDVDKLLLVPRYAALCAREQPLTLAEGRLLGLETALMLARGRECAREKPTDNGARSPTPVDLEESEMHGMIKDLFGLDQASSSPTIEGSQTSDDSMDAQSPTGGSVMTS